MAHEFFGEDDFSYPPELRFSLRALTSISKFKELRQKRRDYMDLNYPALSPLHDRGGPVSVYNGPSGPIVTIAKVMDNVSKGRPAGEGLPPDPLNDPNSP